MYLANRAGLRDLATDLAPLDPSSRYRVAIFGDSFVHGDNVPYDQSICHQLETVLRSSGVNVEILNFGVPAYGTDQAFLRWQRDGRPYEPDLVIAGLQPDNVLRNANLIRLLHTQSGIPFSKPRFVLEEGKLRLVNSPPIRPRGLLALLDQFDQWELYEHEYWYAPVDYADRWWRRSRLAGFLEVKLRENRFNFRKVAAAKYRPDLEPAAVTLAIFSRFRQSVEATGASFLILHLPTEYDIVSGLAGHDLRHRKLLELLNTTFSEALIDPYEELLGIARTEGAETLFSGHYSAKGNRIVAEHAERWLRRADLFQDMASRD